MLHYKKSLLVALLILVSTILIAQNVSLEEFLKNQPQIKSVEEITGNDYFEATYKIMIEQPVDHQNPENGTFLQRVFIANKSVNAPVVYITEGYSGGYAGNPRYINELSPMLGANQICVEHRYFGESWPEPLDWDQLTVYNAATDHHKIAQLLENYYQNKWISTGISKGGQTVVYHRWLYPDDVDASVAYVCPLNFGVEDGRHESFIADQTGTPEMRKIVLDFQLHILQNRNVYQEMLDKFCEEKNYTFRIDNNAVLDYMILEYPFALWQFGISTDEIPELGADKQVIFDHLIRVSSPSYMAIEGQENIKSFFVQAARELGYYGYDIKPFKEYLSISSAHNYLEKIFLPDDLTIKYNKKTAKDVKRFIRKTDARIMFVYGEWDPWSASGFEVPEKDNFLKIIKPKGSHASRIGNLPIEQKKEVKAKLELWLEQPVNIEID